jgi:putative hydrolase of the HAD superfamily
VEAVVCDVGGVFLVPDPGVIAAGLVALGLTPPGTDTLVAAHYRGVRALDEAFAAGSPRGWDAYHAEYSVAVGHADHDGVAAMLADAWARPSDHVWAHVMDDNTSALGRLAESGLAVAIVSNSDGLIEAILADLGICQVGPGPGIEVAVVVDSQVVGVAKPDPRIFAPALEALGTDPAATVYVGDTRHFDVGGARAAGLVPVQIDPLDLARGEAHLRIGNLGRLADHLGC